MSNQFLNKILGKSNSNIVFNFSKSIKENLNHTTLGFEGVPIEPKKTTWDEFDNLLIKDYEFKTKSHMIYFLKELIDYKLSECLIMTIEGDHINVKISNIEGVNIGKNEIMISKYVDEIYEDITFIQF